MNTIKIALEYSYSPYKSIQMILSQSYTDENNNKYLATKDLLDKLNKLIPLKNFQITYKNNNTNCYVLIGTYDNIVLSKIYTNELLINKEASDNFLINIKLRQIIRKENKLKMEFSINDNCEEYDEKNTKNNNSNSFIGLKSRRSKERKIGQVIKKVFMWRKIYTGFKTNDGQFLKLTLEEAADKVGISKKTLDDYFIQLRTGRKLGFNFNEHQNDKIGVLRAFVKAHKYKNEDNQ